MENNNESARSSFSNMGSQTEKYHGILEKDIYKKTRNEFFVLFSYLYSTAPNFHWLHTIMSIYRIWQLIASSFCMGFPTLWESGSAFEKINSIIVLPIYFIPVNSRRNVIPFFLLVFDILIVFLVGFLLLSARYFESNAKLPKSIPSVVTFLFSSLGFILEFLSAAYSGELIGLMISNNESISLTLSIVLLVITLLCFLCYAFIYCEVISISLTFQPNSLQTVTNKCQNFVFVITNVIAFVLGIASTSTLLVRKIATIIAMVLNGVAIYSIFLDGGFTNHIHSTCIAATFISNMVGLAIIVAYLFIDKVMEELFLIVYVVVWVIAVFSFHFILLKIKYMHINILDIIMDDECEFSTYIKSPSKYASILVSGFENAHPYCLSWNFCRAATNQWPNNILMWFLYAKFTAIYPEETMQLVCIGKSIKQHHLKGGFVKQIIDQMAVLVRQREPNLSTVLKSKLNKMNKEVQSTKHKLRNVWDMIIQSNIGEMESAIYQTYMSIEKNEAEFIHLLRQYPNNRFVFRSYSRFLLDVLADYKQYETWDISTKLLARGMSCNDDQAHELGLHTFSLLPSHIKNSVIVKINTESFDDISALETINPDGMDESMEHFYTISDMINNITIPSISRTKVLRIILLIVCVVMVIIAGILFDNFYLSTLSEPLNFIYAFSYMRSMCFHLTAYSIQTVFEKMPSLIQEEFPDLDNLVYLGSTEDTQKQLLHLVKESSLLTVKLGEMQNYRSGNEYMDRARAFIFTDTFQYRTFPSYRNWTHIQMTPYSVFQEYIRLCSSLGNENNITEYNLGDPAIQASFNAMGTMSTIISEALDEVSNYMVHNHKNKTLIVKIVFYTGLVVIPIILIVVIIILLLYIDKDKKAIFKCLAALPKNTVSNIAERLKILKKDANSEGTTTITDGEVNKQEDNMIKILATSDSKKNSRASSDSVSFIGTIIQSICVIVSLVLLSNLFITQSQSLYEAAPHIDYMMGAFGYQIGSFVNLMMIVSIGSGHPIPDIEPLRLKAGLELRSSISVDYLNKLRYGDKESGVVPFKHFSEGMEKAVETTHCLDVDLPSTLHDVYSCFQPENIYMLFDAFSAWLYTPYFQSNGETMFSFNDEMYSGLWHIENIHLYNAFYAPLFSNIVPDVVDDVDDDIPLIFGLSSLFIVIAILTEIVVFYFINETEKRLRYALRLLLHCPPNIITQNPTIMSVLSGNFRKKSNDPTNRDEKYYDSIANNMPDSIMCVIGDHMVFKIRFINQSSLRLFGKTQQECIGLDINDLVDKELNPDLISCLKLTESQVIDDIEYKKSDGQVIHFAITTARLKNETIISFRDTTNTIRYNTLIAEEHAKSDMLLASILPANLAKRVQQGETDICFSVQSVTISFIDIVEFTPWCGSMEASDVMITLNNLFTRFDRIVNSKSTMTKIKCIGDCYMSAGGIFMEVNQPALHAKEVVDFGIASIDAVEDLNSEIGQSLRIRVGVNTGGPVVGGVLGIGKPTFEILGPAINMAQQMEHCGVPMQVHVSRHVYELIYGDCFQIKERGEIAIKNGKVVTYLVTKKEQQS
ncbi:Adenylate and Guanylate cyclase catalytic domain containing protein [Tritrichomonas foetus]|uniref:Adenylate and Guanylate cyclase catalytic domain containing protein n=1 Tax=Tritrichomonas foetus TaxID=1144522 RepID=A0A1J4KEI5_9EUKA|nr:Adenylate and Guanylate cyclase catalytic domain containing protein [Tritrichomonas foetus]|eukprot:OHT09619.1 Adenylate and Guanylate cyclase catalytic domain containing protein [Tritrichomonas foetus]